MKKIKIKIQGNKIKWMKRSNPHPVSLTIILHYIIQDIPISEADCTQKMKVNKKVKTPIKHNNKILY